MLLGVIVAAGVGLAWLAGYATGLDAGDRKGDRDAE
jgi:hypothetical protein